MLAQRIQRVLRTGRLIPAGVGQRYAERIAVELHQQPKKRCHQWGRASPRPVWFLRAILQRNRPLPPYLPELNPIENLWHYLRSHYWANRSYADYDDLRYAAIDAWQNVALDPEIIKSV